MRRCKLHKLVQTYIYNVLELAGRETQPNWFPVTGFCMSYKNFPNAFFEWEISSAVFLARLVQTQTAWYIQADTRHVLLLSYKLWISYYHTHLFTRIFIIMIILFAYEWAGKHKTCPIPFTQDMSYSFHVLANFEYFSVCIHMPPTLSCSRELKFFWWIYTHTHTLALFPYTYLPNSKHICFVYIHT